jgi:quercetin dioxygenase-like cupin family protein
MEEAMNHFLLRDIKPRKPSDGVEMRIIHGERMTMVFFNLQPGSGIPEHSHPHEQMGTVLKGTLELTIAGEKRVVHPGEAYHIPTQIVHSGKCGHSPAEVLEVFAPVREDFK